MKVIIYCGARNILRISKVAGLILALKSTQDPAWTPMTTGPLRFPKLLDMDHQTFIVRRSALN